MTNPIEIVWHSASVSRNDREQLKGHRGSVVWLTGLSGSGKSTIANLVERKLHESGIHSVLLDGDNVRHGLNAPPELLEPLLGASHAARFGLGFRPQDRVENIRRLAAVAELFCHAGIVVLTAFVSPYRRDRALARAQVTTHGRPDDFIEVFIDTPLAVCEQRDPKGLYAKARRGEIKNFTGIDDPYEPPESPDLTIATVDDSPDEAAARIVAFVRDRIRMASG